MRIIGLLILLFPMVVYSASLKIGFVNLVEVLEESPQYKAAQTRLQKEFEPQRNLLLAEQKKLKNLEEQYKRDVDIMSATKKRNLEKEVRDRRRNIKRSADELREDFNIRSNEERVKLERIVSKTIKDLAKRNGYDLVIYDGVLFASKQIDITKLIITKLKQQ